MARHIYQAPLRWSDMDAYQHVNNVQYLRLLEEARVDMLFARNPSAGEQGSANGILVARHEIDYRRPLTYRPEPVRIETAVIDIRAGSFTLAYDIRDDDHLYAQATTKLVCYDLQRKQPRRLSKEERSYLEQFAETAA